MTTPVFSAEIDKAKVAISTVLLLGVGIGCGYYVLHGPNPESSLAMLRTPYIFYPLMGMGALLCLGLSGLGVWKLLGGSPLRAGPEGIDLNGAIKIRWGDIAGVEAYSDFTSSQLRGYKIVLADPERFLAAHREHRLHKRMALAHQTVGSPVVVYTNSLRFDDDKFLQVVGHYLGKTRAAQ
ncbi:hypothetical protein [Pseudomonas sp. CGJS7]|uniref:hypothetical protein n=1 Tax=Pseudomonas sp. CGJS7 TaxID=3109348 RepID=UPI003009E7CA